jgi:hypothetical protein
LFAFNKLLRVGSSTCAARVLATGCALAASGCGGRALDVGSIDGGLALTGRGVDAETDAPAGPLWNGTLKNAQLSDGSNRLVMTLSISADGVATGTLQLGDGQLLAPPTDPNVGYPPGVTFPSAGPLGYFEGFRYTILGGRLSGSDLTFRVAEFELWTQWCALQTTTYSWGEFPEDDAGPYYSCVPNWSWGGQEDGGCTMQNPTTMADEPFDCGKITLCESSPCDCSMTGCHVKSETQPSLTMPFLSFDLTMNGSTADGTMSGAPFGNDVVAFVRAE